MAARRQRNIPADLFSAGSGVASRMFATQSPSHLSPRKRARRSIASSGSTFSLLFSASFRYRLGRGAVLLIHFTKELASQLRVIWDQKLLAMLEHVEYEEEISI